MGLPAISFTTGKISIFFSDTKDYLKNSSIKINNFILKHFWPVMGVSYLLSKYFSIQEGVYFALAYKITLAFSISIIILKIVDIIKDRFFNKKDKDDNAAKDPSLTPSAERHIWDID